MRQLEGNTNTIFCDGNMEKVDIEFDYFVFKRTYKQEKDNLDEKYMAIQKLEAAGLPIQAIINGYHKVILLCYKGDVSIQELEELGIKNFSLKKCTAEELYINEFCNLMFAYYGNTYSDRVTNIGGEVFLGSSTFKKSNDLRYVMKVEYKFSVLEFKVVSFSRYKKGDKGNFVYYWPDGKVVPIRTYQKHGKDLWVKGHEKSSSYGKAKEKNRIDFFLNDTYANFRASKIGLLTSFLAGVNEYLGDFIKVQLCPIHPSIETRTITSHKKAYLTRAMSKYDGATLYLVDHLDTECSRLFKKKLEMILTKQGLQNTRVKSVKKPQIGYNLILLKRPEEYQETNISDPYEKSKDGKINQHIWEENLDKLNETCDLVENSQNTLLVKILQELDVKKEMMDGRLDSEIMAPLKLQATLHYWTREGCKGQWFFVHSQLAPDGSILFTAYSESEFINIKNEDLAIVQAFLKKKKLMNKLWMIEGILYTNEEDILAIVNDKLKVLPEVEAIGQRLKLARPNLSIEKEYLLADLVDFGMTYSNEEEARKLHFAIEELPDIFTLSDFRQKMKANKMSGRNQIMTKFNDYLELKKRDYRLYSNHKGGKFKPYYEALYGINFVDEINGYFKEEAVYYWVGKNNTSGVMQKYGNSAVIRKVLLHDKKQFDRERFIKLLDVDFVRVNEATVVPFLAKYHREFYDMGMLF